MSIDGAREIWYTYGIDGVSGMTVKENNVATDYQFDKNAQGDVTHIYTVENGTPILVATYAYDAWGAHKVLTPAGAESADPAFIGNVNPFRYRSYYYDEETGLYYLNARYYDPETGRFISADTPEVLTATGDHPNGLNLYAYCLNNPVMEVDPSGRFVFSLAVFLGAIIVGAVSGAAIGGSVAYNQAKEQGKSGKDLFWSTMAGLGIGALGGAIAGAGAYFGAGFVFGGLGLLANTSVTFGSIVAGVGIGAGTGFISGFGGNVLSSIAQHIAINWKDALVSGFGSAMVNLLCVFKGVLISSIPASILWTGSEIALNGLVTFGASLFSPDLWKYLKSLAKSRKAYIGG